jgi:hypothetical protein
LEEAALPAIVYTVSVADAATRLQWARTYLVKAMIEAPKRGFLVVTEASHQPSCKILHASMRQRSRRIRPSLTGSSVRKAALTARTR